MFPVVSLKLSEKLFLLSRAVSIGHSGEDKKKIFPTTVTRFGEISPIWQNFRCLCQFSEGCFVLGKVCEPHLAAKKAVRKNFIVIKWTNFDQKM